MGGQRNPKMLKLVGGAAALLISTYVLYSYRQASNNVQLKTRHLSEAKEEYSALSRRFDMLTNELKGSVQASADLDRQLRVEKKSHQQTLNEKQEVERQCRTEAIRLENEMAQVVKEKQQLIEDKDQVKRERDRISAQLDTLTQECGEARDVAQSQEHQLQEKLKQCQTRSGSVDGELSKCRSSLMEATGVESQCNSELQVLRDARQECQNNRISLQKQLKLLQNQAQQREGFNNNNNNNQRQGFDNPQHRGDFNNPRDFNAPLQGGVNIPQQGGPGNSWRNDQVNRAQPGYQDRDTNFNPAFQQERKRHDSLDTGGQQAVGGYQNRDANFHPHDSVLRRDTGAQQAARDHDQEELQALGHQEPGHEELGQAQAAGGHHKTLDEKRNIYRVLKYKVQKGIVLNDKQLQVYQLLYRQFGDEEDQPVVENPVAGLQGQEPAPRLVEEGAEQPAPQLVGDELDENRARGASPLVAGGIRQPPEGRIVEGIQEPPGGQMVGGIQQPPEVQNEQEEVKDLVDGGQQKPEVFENVKEHQPDAVEEGGAGGPNNEDSDEGVELRGLVGGGKQLEEDGDHLPKPIPNPLDHADPELQGAREVEREGVEDDEEYGAVNVEGKQNLAAGDEDTRGDNARGDDARGVNARGDDVRGDGDDYRDDGRRAGQQMYNQERQRLVQRQAEEKVPNEDERDRDEHHRVGAVARREMR